MDSRLRTVGAFVTLAAVWGFSFLSIAVGLESLAPLLFAAFRYDVAAVVLLGYALVRGADWRPTAPADAAVVAGGVFLVSANGFLFVGQQTVASGVAAIMQSLVPIVTSLWALALLPEERVPAAGAVGIGLGLTGVLREVGVDVPVAAKLHRLQVREDLVVHVGLDGAGLARLVVPDRDAVVAGQTQCRRAADAPARAGEENARVFARCTTG